VRIGVIGAGVTGLTAARLLSGEHDVVVFEKGDLGGLAGAAAFRGTSIDKFYHHIFTNDDYIIKYIDELGLGDEMIWMPAKNGLFMDAKLYPFTNPIDLILFPKVSFLGRLRMGFTVLGAKRIKDFSEMETISAKEWIIGKAGRRTYDTLWAPLLSSKFDNDADNVSGVWLWNKFKLRGSTRKGVNKEYLGYLRGGFIALYEKMTEGLSLLFEAVTKIEKNDKGILIKTDSRTELFDKVIFTGPSERLFDLCEFPMEYGERLKSQKHKANICMTLFLSKPLSDYYWITVAEKDAPFVLVIEHTNLFDNPAYGGDKVVYLSRYLDASDPLFAASDDFVRETFLVCLKSMFPNFDERDILGVNIFRDSHAQPVVFQRHSERILPFETPVEGLFVANMGQIYPEDRGQNYAIRLGEDVASIVIRDV